ncbi:PilZ domain-containing protein [Pelotalea chapellei]|uniref:PilZ domain-containing protein n=1 Tax=Pelotalea chapellei TaxID=44671 RepID=A0ABS5UAA6_9BACT|nr:PilZ domain-containing protein [Pelotalea chapellei]MBT1072618.1 PilZ domain-containing protein [Pelotalea chapellei]
MPPDFTDSVSEETPPDYPILVVSYDDKSRSALAVSLEPYGGRAILCSTFCEAESYALSNMCKGILVDLATMIKSKGEEKIVAYTLVGFYPTLRVKTMGAMLIPMAMAGDAKQDKNLKDFLTRTCADFKPRKLRTSKRKDICIPTFIGVDRGFTLNISWSGVFVANMNPERFTVGEELTITFPDFGLDVVCVVARIQNWGQQRPPGIGVKFKHVGKELENNLYALLKSQKNIDRDRLIG